MFRAFSATVSILLGLPAMSLAAGTYHFQFLRVGVDARPGAMGGAYVAIADGLVGFTWNTAGLSGIRESQALAAYMRFPDDVQAGQVALGRRLGGGWRVGLAVRYLSYGSITRTTTADPVGQHSGTFSASDVGVTVGAAYPLTSSLRVGAGATYVSGSIDAYKANAVGVDLGFLLDLPWNGVSLGGSLANLQVNGSSYAREDITLPTEQRAGLGFRSPSGRTRVAVDLAGGSEVDLHFAAGVEMLVGHSMWFRSGVNQGGREVGQTADGWGSLSGFSWGVGFFWEEWRVDYGISPFGSFGTTHRISIRSEV